VQNTKQRVFKESIDGRRFIKPTSLNTMNAMITGKSVCYSDRDDITQCTPLSFMQGEIDAFTEFLNEFTGGRSLQEYLNDSFASQTMLVSEVNHSLLHCPVTKTDSRRTTMQSESTDDCVPSSLVYSNVTSSCAPRTVEATSDGISSHRDTSLSDKVLSYSTLRKFTNTTYLRRMHLSREDAQGLLPKVQGILKFAFAKDLPSFPFKRGVPVLIRDTKGRQWSVVLECLRAAGQRHVRLNRGWSEMCRANGLSFGKEFRLDRWVRSSSTSPLPSSSSVLRQDEIVVLSTL